MKRRMKKVINGVVKTLLHGGVLVITKTIPETGTIVRGTRTDDDKIDINIKLVGEDRVSP